MLVPREGEPDAVKVLDFGIAKLSAEDTRDQPALTRVGSVFGTPEYMSPEQAVGQSVDARSDLYTVGILLYEMLSGHTPFAGDGGMVGVLTRQMTAEPPALAAGVDPELAALVMTQLAKLPDQRIQTADELLSRLRQLEGTLTPSPPPGAAAGRSSLELGDTVLGLEASVAGPPASVAAASVPGTLLAGTDTTALAAPGAGTLAATLQRTVRIGGQPVPVWLLAAVGVALMAVVVFVVGGVAIAASSGGSGSSMIARAKEKLVSDPKLQALIKKAEGGRRRGHRRARGQARFRTQRAGLARAGHGTHANRRARRGRALLRARPRSGPGPEEGPASCSRT